jgi:predicted dehydrogenase
MVKAQRHANADLNHQGTSGDWYFDVVKSGGYLIEQSVHNLDLCNWAIGALPLRATGLGAIVLYKNQPPGRSIFDCGSITYDYPGGLKMSFTQNVFHPRGLPAGGQYLYLYGSKGAIDLMAQGPATMFPLGPGNPQPVVLAERVRDDQHNHIAKFFGCVRGAGPNPAGIEIGAAAALTAILGHLAMTRERMVSWEEMGVEV